MWFAPRSRQARGRVIVRRAGHDSGMVCLAPNCISARPDRRASVTLCSEAAIDRRLMIYFVGEKREIGLALDYYYGDNRGSSD